MKANATIVLIMALAMIATVLVARDLMDSKEQDLFAQNKGDLGADAGFLSKYTQAYQIDEAHANTNFFRWQSGVGTIWVVRTTTSGTVTTWEKATGTWANRTSLTYEPIND